MNGFQPADGDFEARVRASYARMPVMGLIGAELAVVRPGHVEIELPYRPDLCQQHGFFHAGMVATIADTAGGYAAFSLFAADSAVLAVEFKINLMSPAAGERLRAVGRVLKPGRTLTVCEIDVFAARNGAEKLCARMQQTCIQLAGRDDLPAG